MSRSGLADPALATARAATTRHRLINVAGRVAHHAGSLHLHLPTYWPWQDSWQQAWYAVHAPPN